MVIGAADGQPMKTQIMYSHGGQRSEGCNINPIIVDSGASAMESIIQCTSKRLFPLATRHRITRPK